MALAITESVALVGADAHLVRVEVDIGTGVPGFRMVGLPNASVREAEQRIRSALLACNERWVSLRKTANLAPGALRKEGTHFDLPLALGVAAADEGIKLDPESLEGWVSVGELALDGGVRRVRGALAAAIECRRTHARGLVCPAANASEAGLVEGVRVVAIETLQQGLDFFRGSWAPPPIPEHQPVPEPIQPDLRAVRGHPFPKMALEVAAAGGHNLLMIGPPGSGKTMLAKTMPGILPPMSFEESLDVTKIHSVAGLLPENVGLISSRPFRAPHHNISPAGLVGGGTGLPRPGELSLAHHGTLFLDEIALFRRDVLESLRSPLEDGTVRIARSGGVIAFPCHISVVAAMNPCPCGYLDDPEKECRCTEMQVSHYRNKLSGPLLDRMDLQTNVERLTHQELLGEPEGESSSVVRARVVAARERQQGRYRAALTNASVPRAILEDHVSLGPASRSQLRHAIENDSLSGRGVDRVLRVSRTLADLQGEERVSESHVAQALSLRLLQTELRVAS